MRSTMVGFAVLVVLGGVLAGCADGPASPSTNPTVNMTSSFSNGSNTPVLFKSTSGLATDSLRVDSAVVVLQRIKFESDIDTVSVDTMGMGSDVETERDLEVTLRGPFVIHVRDTIAIDLASQVLPAGTYNGVKFKVHRLQPGEQHVDSDERSGHSMMSVDSLPYGSSVMIWGRVKNNGTWVPFTFAFDGELEFKVKGNFVVSDATSSVSIALHFDMGVWFTTPTGTLLDPTDTSSGTRELIRASIVRSFQECRGGRDGDHDGHPDD